MKRKRRAHWDQAIADVENDLRDKVDRYAGEGRPQAFALPRHDNEHGFELASASAGSGSPTRDETCLNSAIPHRRRLARGHSADWPDNDSRSNDPGILSERPDDVCADQKSFENILGAKESVAELFDGALKAAHTTYPKRKRKQWKTVERSRGSPHSIYSSEFRRRTKIEPQASWTPKKLATLELATARLATQLLICVSRLQDTGICVSRGILHESAAAHARTLRALKNTLRTIADRLDAVKRMMPSGAGAVSRLEYPQFETGLSPDALNASLLTIFQERTAHKISYAVALSKIAYNLMVSPAAPDVKTFSVLLNRFSRDQQNEAAHFVIRAFLDSHTKVDEMIANDILTYYRRIKDRDKFHSFARKLQGLDGGCMLANPRSPRRGVGAARLVHSGSKVIQALEPDQMLFETLITGYSQFDMVRQASDMYKWMNAQKIVPDVAFGLSLLRVFAKQCDWSQGMALFRTVRARISLQSMADVALEGDLYYLGMQLCKNCLRFGEFNILYREALDLGLPLDKILRNAPVVRGTSPAEDAQRSFLRRARILHRQVEVVADDLRAFALQVLTAKVILGGADRNILRQALMEYRSANDLRVSERQTPATDSVWAAHRQPSSVRQEQLKTNDLEYIPRQQHFHHVQTSSTEPEDNERSHSWVSLAAFPSMAC